MKISTFSILALFSTLSLLAYHTHASIGGYISLSDKKKFLQVLSKSFNIEGDDVSSSYYGAKGLKLLNEPYEKSVVSDNCAHIKKNFNPAKNMESTFNALSTWSLLGCQGSLHNSANIKDIAAVVENDKSSLLDLRYAAETLSLLKQAIPNPTKVVQLIQAKLKEDDSLQNIGHALHLSALLGNAGKFAQDRIEDVVVQADEVDGKILQWEGGLTTTSLLITGLLRLPGATPFTPVQAEKLANYLLTRKTVQTSKGVWALLEAATALSASSVSPVSISVVGSAQVTVDKPELRIQVSDLFGQALKPAPGAVVAQSVKRVADDQVVTSKQALTGGSSTTEFVLVLKQEPGFYHVVLSVGSHTAAFNAKISGPISIKSLEIGLSDADGSSALKLSQVTYPGKLGSTLQADSSQHLVVKFAISRNVHQAFLRLYSGRKEIVFVAEQDTSKQYKVEVNLAKELSNSGTFEMELILGDAIVMNPIRWLLGSIEVSLGSEAPQATKPIRGPKPEIKHLFRPAEKRPAEAVSLFFTALTASPFLILLILWGKLGINFGNFTVVALPFHAGFGASLALFTLFWLKLDMFVTCAWLIPIGGFTFLSGHKLLSCIARSRKQEK
ncbi:oligosaccharide transferase Delta subunit [Leptinotarsa decemlineata]|uniref:oligosaccharide transferase Delta subunit n=1 Tax=Leptinotarsa decemlineata TaxID=7539 RepID=UPI003D30CC5D